MKKRFLAEDGAAYVVEAIIIYPILFVCTMFLIVSGFIFVQKSMLQSTADRLSTYIAHCIACPGYSEIVDPFYEAPKNTGMTTRIEKAMQHSDPYRYVAGFLGLNSDVKTVSDHAGNVMAEKYLPAVSFLKPSSGDVSYPDELKNLKPKTKDGYVCAISANTSTITVWLGQNFVFMEMFRFIGIGGESTTVFGKSSASVCDTPEMIRVIDFSFDTVEDIAGRLGVDVKKIQDFIAKLKG